MNTQNAPSTADIVAGIINSSTFNTWMNGVSDNSYGGGLEYTLYLDLDDNTLLIDAQGGSGSWLQRDDGSLVRIMTYMCLDTAIEDPYDGWWEYYVEEIEERLTDALM